MSSEAKTRYYTTPSSLASYFGCGFNTPEEQYKIDMGAVAPEFDEDSMLRMELGNYLEDAVIEYFQNIVFKTPITERNTETKWGFDDKIRYKIDGKMVYNDKPTIFENKISNSQSYRFTENMGYYMQVQAYMLCENVDQAILAGLYQGKPVWKLIERDEEMIEDIKTMVRFLVSSLNGIVDFYDSYPVDLLEKYSDTKVYEPITKLSHRTIKYLHQMAELNAEKKAIEDEIKAVQAEFGDNLEISEGVYEDDVVRVSVSRWKQKGGFDLDAYRIDHPAANISKYMKPDTERSRLVIKLKKEQ